MNSEHFGTCRASMPASLVIQLARFGDLIQTKRLVRSLLAHGEVHLLVDNSLCALARLVYPGVVIHGIAAHKIHDPAFLMSVCESLALLATTEFHRIYNLNFSGLNFALAGMFPVEKVRGYRMHCGQRLMDAWPAQVMRWTRTRSTSGINLMDVWGLYADHVMSPEQVNPAAVPRGHGLGVVMAGQNARRSLPPTILAPLVHAAYARVGHGPIHLLGAGGERRAARELVALLPLALRSEVRDLVGQTGWQELFEVVGSLDLLLSPDTGPMHLAAHCGVPVMAFFLSSAWCHETGPYGTGHCVLQAVPECAPCLETEPCPCKVRCRRIFSDPAMLRYVSGQTGRDVPAECVVMSSGFDGLGLTWTVMAGHDPYASARAGFRALAAGIAGVEIHHADMPLHMDDVLIREKDWMLHHTLRGRAHA